MKGEAPTRSTDGTEDNASRRMNAPTIDILNGEQVIDNLLAAQDDRIRRHLAIRRPEDLSDAEYRAAYDQAHEAEYGPRPPPWDEAGPDDRDVGEVVETLLLHLDYVDGDAVARAWWWERFRWLRRCHPKARAVGRALERRRDK